ncbi:nicotinamidase-like [Babylonia areolata]|uniref:nicotinamidase-like n=1 Tax=Babylonia areolata TaxID=304850 RepID=UPI003FD396E4
MKSLQSRLVFVALVNCLLVVLTRSGAAAEPSKAALLIIDVQDCFLPGGSLAVSQGDQVIPVINKIRADYGSQFSIVVLSQDWHCSDHVSFASQHPGVKPYFVVPLKYNAKGQLCFGSSVPDNYTYAVNCSSVNTTVNQTVWPDHCIQNETLGPTSAQFSTSLTREPTDVVIQKGDSCGVDSYSAFYDNGGFKQTALNQVLKSRDIGVVVVTGLALDYCVYYTSKDAHRLGYKVLTVTDAARGVANDSTAAALEDMRKTGVELVTEAELGEALQRLTSTAVQHSTTSVLLLVLTASVLTASSWS